jgi:hypothetical protein
MKKTFITKEYSCESIEGTFNMKETRAFFASKILEIEDIMKVDENDIIWTEASNNTQGLGVDNESRSLDTNILKLSNHRFSYSQQADSQIKEFPSWDININTYQIITEYIFAQLKKYRTFTGISNNKTSYGNVNTAIKEYIKYNVIPRIKFSHIDLYVKYYRVGETQDNGITALQNNSQFNEGIIAPLPLSGETTGQFINRVIEYKKGLKVGNFQLRSNIDQSNVTITYKQIQNALNYKFDYYFDVIYVKA